MLLRPLIAALAVSCACSVSNADSPFEGYRFIDLSHAFNEHTIYWPTETGFRLEPDFVGETEGGWHYESFTLHTPEHGGTHLDAPIHFAKGGWSTDEVPLSSLITPAVVIDVRELTADNADYQLTTAAIEQWEAQHGTIPEGCAVLLNTGYAAYWPDRERYMGTSKRGTEGVAALHFPGFSLEAATFLLSERRIVAVGLDTPSIDFGQSKDFLVHRYLYQHNVVGYENVGNLNDLPAKGSYIIALPMKVEGGSGGPLRIVALVPLAS